MLSEALGILLYVQSMQPFLMPVSGNLILSSELQEHKAHVWYTDIYASKALIDIKMQRKILNFITFTFLFSQVEGGWLCLTPVPFFFSQ